MGKKRSVGRSHEMKTRRRKSGLDGLRLPSVMTNLFLYKFPLSLSNERGQEGAMLETSREE